MASPKRPTSPKKSSANKKPKKAAKKSPKKAAAPKKAAPKKAAAKKKASPKKAAPKKASAKKNSSLKKAAATKAAPKKPSSAGASDRDALVVATGEALTGAWASWGVVDPLVLTHILNPMFMGGPRWPGIRQAYRVVRRGGEVLLASDGLADPFEPADPPDRNGHGVEVYAITNEPVGNVAGSWLWNLVWNAAQLAAGRPDIGDLIEELGLVSSELHDVAIPEEHVSRFVNAAGRVGVLLNLADPRVVPASIDGPLSKVRLVNVKLLTLDELTFVIQGGEAARAELAKRFLASESPLVSSFSRASVV